jgi:hypothetical protein
MRAPSGFGFTSLIVVSLVIAGGTGSRLLAGSLLSTSPLVIPVDQDPENFVSALANAGDVNGDGFADLIVGVNLADNGEVDEGRAFLYLGGPAGYTSVPSWIAESNQADSWFGNAVAGAGDVNGDGFADVLVGAVRFIPDQFSQGRTYLYLGSAAGLATDPAWTTDGDQPRGGGEYGISLASAGDVNGDGFDDVIIGAAQGNLRVYHGSAQGLSQTPAWTVNIESPSFVVSVDSAGDTNGDGYDDIIIGDVGYSNGQDHEGRAFVYLGSAGGLATSPAWSVEGDQDLLSFGQSVAGAGDVNGDGYDDLVVGTPFFGGLLTEIGKAWLYLGSASGPSSVPAWTAGGDISGARFGFNVAAAGDVDGDGRADVAIAAIGHPGSVHGRAYLFKGIDSGLEAVPSWDTGSFGGFRVGSSGDLNGDGYGDVLTGAGGNAHVYFSCANEPIADAGPNQRVLPNHAVTFNATGTLSGTPPLDYAWDVDGDGVPDASGVVATYPGFDPGTYTVRLTVTDALRCTTTDSFVVRTRGPRFQASPHKPKATPSRDN